VGPLVKSKPYRNVGLFLWSKSNVYVCFKIRTFEVSESVKISDKNCRTINENNYLIKNIEIFLSKKNNEICVFSSVDGNVREE
jgi:hypothetical protein